MRRIGSVAARIAALLFVLIVLLYVRILISGGQALHEAEATSDDALRIERLGHAARLYAPGSPFSSRAFDALSATCGSDGAAQEIVLAACRELRSSILATRSFYTPHADRLGPANARIAAILAATESPSVDPNANQAARQRWHAERLAQDLAPKTGWVVLALLGFAGWIGSALGFFYRGLGEGDRLRPRVALACGLGVGLGFACFLLGLVRA